MGGVLGVAVLVAIIACICCCKCGSKEGKIYSKSHSDCLHAANKTLCVALPYMAVQLTPTLAVNCCVSQVVRWLFFSSASVTSRRSNSSLSGASSGFSEYQHKHKVM